jgi:DNA-binding NtrC family response regulator
MAHTVLIVDGEPVQRELLIHSLQNRLGYRTVSSASASDAHKYFYADNTVRPDVILFDWPFAPQAEIFAGLKALSVYAPVVALVKYGDYDSAMVALSNGAQDFLTKPVAMERISTTFRNILLLRDARREVERLRRDRMEEAGQSHLVANSGHMPLSVPLISEDGNVRRMQDIEAESIRFAMQYYHGRMTEVARRLGIGRSTLYRKLSELSIKQQEAA